MDASILSNNNGLDIRIIPEFNTNGELLNRLKCLLNPLGNEGPCSWFLAPFDELPTCCNLGDFCWKISR